MEIFDDFLRQIAEMPLDKVEELKENYDNLFDSMNNNNALINEIREQFIKDGITEQDLISMREDFKTFGDGLVEQEESIIKQELFKKVIDKTSYIIDEILIYGCRPIIKMPIELCHKNALVPKYANRGDAGMDVYSPTDTIVKAGETTLIKLGIKIAVPPGYEMQVRPRSGMSLKTKIRVANAPGTIDSGYRDECGVIIDNIGNEDYFIKQGDRIAQFVLSEVPTADFEIVDDIAECGGNRGGGFGSTGK